MTRFRSFYGSQPLHLLASVVSSALVAAGFVKWFTPGSDGRGVILWFVGCLLGFTLLLMALAWLLDGIAFGMRAASGQRAPSATAQAHLLVPALLSGLLLLVFLPLIFQFGKSSFVAASGIIPSGYLFRWLYATAALFGGSALVYALRLFRRRRRTARSGAESSSGSATPAPGHEQ
jgi:hypothetical protein